MYKKTILLICIILCLIAVIQGCGEGDEPLLSSTLTDDGTPPHSPSWRDTPYTIEKLYEEHYKVTLQWNKVTTNRDNNPKDNLAGYKLLKSDANGNLISTFMTPTQPGSSYEFYVDTDPNLQEGKSFSYRLIAFDTYFRESTTSGPQLINISTQNSDKPKAVSGLRYDALSGNGQTASVILYWDSVKEYEDGSSISSNLQGYEIYRSDGSIRPEIPLAIVTPENLSYVDTGISDREKTYRYWIRAVDNKGAKSSYSSAMAVSFDAITNPPNNSDYDDNVNVPGAPHVTKVSMLTLADGSTEWTIEWEAPEKNSDNTDLDDINQYKIYRADSVDGIYSIIGVTASRKFVYTTSSTKSYYYRVSCIDDSIPANEGLWSGAGYDGINSGSTTFLPDINGQDIYGKKISLAINPVSTTDTAIGIQWYDMGTGSDIDVYKIYRSLFSEGPYQLIGSVADTDRADNTAYEYNDSRNLLGGKTYYYRIAATNVAGECGLSYYVKSTVTLIGQIKYEFESLSYGDANHVPALVSGGNPSISFTDADTSRAMTYTPQTSATTSPVNEINNCAVFKMNPINYQGTYEFTVRYLDNENCGNYVIALHPCNHLFGNLGGQSLGTFDSDTDNIIGTVSITPDNPATNTWKEVKTTIQLAEKFSDDTDDYIWVRVQYVAQGAGSTTAAGYDGRCVLDWIQFDKQ